MAPPTTTLQLVSPAAEATFFSGLGDASQTFWRTAWKKHTPFAIEPVVHHARQSPSTEGGGVLNFIISNAGDLMGACYLAIKVTKHPNLYPSLLKGAYYPAEACVREAALRIGSVTVDRQPNTWFRFFDIFHRTEDQRQSYRRMTNFDALTLLQPIATQETLYLPLLFSSCRHPAAALPLCALLGSEVRVDVSLATCEEAGVLSIDGVELITDMVYLDDAERAFFSGRGHDILVEQVQTNLFDLPAGMPSETTTTAFNARLGLFRPLKALYFALQDITESNVYTNYCRFLGERNVYQLFSDNAASPSGLASVQVLSEKLAPIASANLLLNGASRFSVMPGEWWNTVSGYSHAKACTQPGVYMMPFALRPESLQPTGSLCATIIDQMDLALTLKKSVANDFTETAVWSGPAASQSAYNITGLTRLVVHAWSLNVLRIEGGRGQLLFGEIL